MSSETKEKSSARSFNLKAKVYFLTYKGTLESRIKITKQQLANYLLYENPNDITLKPEKYLICEQKYESGEPHFHVILTYPKRKSITTQNYFDYLSIHPNIETMRNMKAALDYVYKEDPNPITNMDVAQEHLKARAKNSSSFYALLQQQMLKDPLKFDAYKYCKDHQITKQMHSINYTKAVHLVNKMQAVACNQHFLNLPSIKLITRKLIQENLTSEQLQLYDSWEGYQMIVDHLNSVPTHGGHRPHKSKNLLLVGRPNIGKTTLALKIQESVATYGFGVENWFPKYQNWVYPMILWNQFNLRTMPYPQLLNILEGIPTDLPYKGGSTLKRDNQLIYMTSNMNLEQHIRSRFSNEEHRALARANLKARITQVEVPQHLDLFLLTKLIVPN